MPDLALGTRKLVTSGSGRTYELYNNGGVYSCSCPAWRNQSAAIDRRTCKHLKAERGTVVEDARVAGRPVPGLYRTMQHQPSTTVRLPAAGKPGPVSMWDKLAGDDDVFDEAPPFLSPSVVLAAPAPVVAASEPAKDEPEFKVLLAETWDGEQNPYNWMMSEKLDGVRAYWNGTDFISRLGNRFHAPEWFTRNLPNTHLDGELWIRQGWFQETVSIVRRQDMPDDWDQVSFMCFDAPNAPGTFRERYHALQEARPQINNQWLNIVGHEACQSKEHLMRFLRQVEARGGEGVMLRDRNSQYVHGRSSTLLKVKSFYDAEALVVGYSAGKGRHRGRLGAYECETLAATVMFRGKPMSIPGGRRFNVGTGLSDADRNFTLPVGTTITYKFQEFTKDMSPRFPVFVGRRGDV